MTDESQPLLDKISVLIAGEEVSLSPAEAVMAGCFVENALTTDDAMESIPFGEASHG